MFHHLDPTVQGGMIVIGQHGNLDLCDDRAVVHSLVHEMNRHPCHRNTGPQCLRHRIYPGKGG